MLAKERRRNPKRKVLSRILKKRGENELQPGTERVYPKHSNCSPMLRVCDRIRGLYLC